MVVRLPLSLPAPARHAPKDGIAHEKKAGMRGTKPAHVGSGLLCGNIAR